MTVHQICSIEIVEEFKKGYEKHCIEQEGNCSECEYNNDTENCIWNYIKKNLNIKVVIEI